MTFGADGTMHRNINYNVRHANLKVESYSTDEGAATNHKTRLLGVHSALDGSSEQSIKSWKKLLGDITEIYNQSPLAKRTGCLLQVMEIFIKLAGMITDHCSKEKKDAHFLEKEKMSATYQSLGENEILNKMNQELLPHFLESRKKMIKATGGNSKWNALSEVEKAERQSEAMEQLVIELGKESYELLSDDEKRILKLFIWAGCGCHKDLNTVRGGNISMMAWWKENNITPPVLLANRDNAAVLKDHSSNTDIAGPAVERALEMTTRGGAKTAKLAGDIFNNKNDKKGHHDTFRWWWMENVKENFTFPDTSNNHFQTHCEAAACLLCHLPHYIKFLEYIRERKQNMRFSHMEQNLWNALHCVSTKT